jgi:hypothetical protein
MNVREYGVAELEMSELAEVSGGNTIIEGAIENIKFWIKVLTTTGES